MSSYPGENPQAEPPEQPNEPAASAAGQGADGGTEPRDEGEPTAPITPSSPGFPGSAYPTGQPEPHAGQTSPGQPFPAGAQPVPGRPSPPGPPRAPARPTLPYSQAPFLGYPAEPPLAPSTWDPQPGYYATGGTPVRRAWAPTPPDHPQAVPAMIVGIVGLFLGLMCGVGFLASPFAWALGRNALRAIEAEPGRYGGAGAARTGMYTGIAGTVLLGLGLLLAFFVAILFIASAASSGNV